jgi:hypothetical protein
MDTGVGPAGRVGDSAVRKKALEHALEFQLDRASGGLALPPDKAGAVVL